MQSQIIWYCHRFGPTGCRVTFTLVAFATVRNSDFRAFFFSCIEQFENTKKDFYMI